MQEQRLHSRLMAHFLERLDTAKNFEKAEALTAVDNYMTLLRRFLIEGLYKDASAHDIFIII